MTESMQERWPERPAEPLRIYRCAAPAVTERTAAALAERLGVPIGRFGETRSTADRVSYAEGGHRVTVYRGSGGLRYRNLTLWQVDHGGDLDLGDERAVELAREFVARRELAPLPECRVAKVTRLRAGLADREGKVAEERVIDVGVIFRRVLDGVAADGPGGHLMVYLGAEGEVTGFDRIWRPVEGVERVVKELSRSRGWRSGWSGGATPRPRCGSRWSRCGWATSSTAGGSSRRTSSRRT